MKKILGLIMTTLTVSFIIVSCGNSQTLSSSTQKADVTTAAPQVVTEASTISTTTLSSMLSSETTTTKATTQQVTNNPEETSSIGQEAVSPGGTGGEFVFAYYWKMAIPHVAFFPEGQLDAFVEWENKVWADKDSLNKGRGSLYDFIHDFDVSEEYVRNQNSKMLDPFTDEEISDLYALTKEEFNQKYKEPYFIVKGEAMYNIQDLMLLPEKDLSALGVTKEEISAQLDKEYERDPETVEYLRNKYGY